MIIRVNAQGTFRQFIGSPQSYTGRDSVFSNGFKFVAWRILIEKNAKNNLSGSWWGQMFRRVIKFL